MQRRSDSRRLPRPFQPGAFGYGGRKRSSYLLLLLVGEPMARGHDHGVGGLLVEARRQTISRSSSPAKVAEMSAT